MVRQRIDYLIKLTTLETKRRTINAQLYHSFFLLARACHERMMLITMYSCEADTRESSTKRFCARRVHACAKIGGYITGPSKTTWKTVSYGDCVERRYILFVYPVYLSWNAVNTDTNCQITFSKVHLLLTTCKIIFWRYTRESMCLSNIYAWEMYEFAIKAKHQFTVVSLSILIGEYTSRITSSSLIIIRACLFEFVIFIYFYISCLMFYYTHLSRLFTFVNDSNLGINIIKIK